MSVPIDLSGRSALVTGGSRGIGRAAADILAAAGARVAVNYRADDSAAEDFVRRTRAAGGDALALAGDVGKPDEARQLVRDVVAAWGRLDILVNNAGIWEEDVAGSGDLDVWDRTIAVNLRGAHVVTRQVEQPPTGTCRPQVEHRHELAVRTSPPAGYGSAPETIGGDQT